MEKVQPVSRMISTTSCPTWRDRSVATKSGSKSERVTCALRARGRETASEARRKEKSKNGEEGEGDAVKVGNILGKVLEA